MNRSLKQHTLSCPYTIMGILNVTPDSFSDGGRYNAPSRILQQCGRMVSEGAQIIDVGGESSRPGANPVSQQEEIDRVIPVIRKIREKYPNLLISVDTYKSRVAEQALQNGADWINDISALRFDPEMAGVVSHYGCPVVLMHMQGTPRNMQQCPQYHDVVGEVKDFLAERVREAIKHNILPCNIIVDPGIGFGKALQHNLQLLQNLSSIVELGYPVLLGASRKSFIGSICGEKKPDNRLGGTVATSVWGYLQGAAVFRVHDVEANRQALEMICELQPGR